MNKIKVVATINNSSNSLEVIQKLILNGVDAIKINMNDVSIDDTRKIIEDIRVLNKKLDTGIGTILEIGKPIVHLGKVNDGSSFRTGDKIRLYIVDTIGDSTKASLSNPDVIKEVSKDNIIYTSNKVKLKVCDKGPDYIICEVLVGGEISSYDEVYIDKDTNYLKIKDIKDIEFASLMKVDYLLLPRVQDSDDVMQVTDILIGLKNDHTGIISKIDSKDSVNRIDEIIKISDGVLIDRNSLSMELPMERIPGLQKMIISKSLRSGKLSLISIDLPSLNKPSRIEVQDIANASLDGIDAILINDNINYDNIPIKSIKTLESILSEVEDSIDYDSMIYNASREENGDITGMIATNVSLTSSKLKCKAIITPTISGYTARKISRFRPSAPIIAVSPNMETVTSLSLHFGIAPVLIDDLASLDKIIKTSESIAACLVELKKGDKIIITGGYPFKETKNTNFMKIEEI